MEIRNQTPFPALAFKGLTVDSEAFQVVVLRQTFTFASGTLAFADEQSPLCEEDAFVGEPNQSSVQAESDLCPFKPRCDIVVNATAHAPGGRPARSFHVRLQVWKPGAPHCLVDKTLLISGPSQFRRRSFILRCIWLVVKAATLGIVSRNPWKRTRPGKMLQLPVRYEHAFGGQAKVVIGDRAESRVKPRDWLPGVTRKALQADFDATGQSAPLAWTVCEANPIGQGFAEPWFLKAARIRALSAPQIEAPEAPVTARLFHRRLRGKDLEDPAFMPRGLGIPGKTWLPRRSLLGTVDEAWAKSGRPLPEDFSFAIWNCAPPDQQVPILLGDEFLQLTNLCAPDQPGAGVDPNGQTILRLELPGHVPHLMACFETGEMVPVLLDLDTLHLDPERSALILVWRTVLPMEPGIRTLQVRMLCREQKEAWLAQGGPEGPPPFQASAQVSGYDSREGSHG
jgi:hypothetical protein